MQSQFSILLARFLTVFALMAYAFTGDKDKYLKICFDGYLSKPLKTKELVDDLVRVVSS
jgi:CheY-like chemotaxis protein